MQADADTPAESLPDRFPVSILVEKQQRQRGAWTFAVWDVTGVVTAEQRAGNRSKVLVHTDQARRQFLWSGYRLSLYKDAAESYWNNLTGTRPSLFVVCREEDEGEVVPFLVTADHAEADAHLESEDAVYSVPIPPDLYQWIERYVVANYVPQEKYKRKRKNWAEESGYDKAPGPAGSLH